MGGMTIHLEIDPEAVPVWGWVVAGVLAYLAVGVLMARLTWGAMSTSGEDELVAALVGVGWPLFLALGVCVALAVVLAWLARPRRPRKPSDSA